VEIEQFEEFARAARETQPGFSQQQQVLLVFRSNLKMEPTLVVVMNAVNWWKNHRQTSRAAFYAAGVEFISVCEFGKRAKFLPWRRRWRIRQHSVRKIFTGCAHDPHKVPYTTFERTKTSRKESGRYGDSFSDRSESRSALGICAAMRFGPLAQIRGKFLGCDGRERPWGPGRRHPGVGGASSTSWLEF
jgi:hypothetical protein